MKADSHIHLLPGIDTGPSRATEAAAMFHRAYELGVRTFVASPHYYADRETIGEFLTRRRAAFRRLVEAVGPRIYRVLFLASAEVYLFPGVASLTELPSLCIPGTNILPVTFSPSRAIPNDVMRELAHLVQKRSITPMFCHIERHHALFTPDSFRALLSFTHGVFCVDASAFPCRDLSESIIRALGKEKRFFLASNAHNNTSRPPLLFYEEQEQVNWDGPSHFVMRRLSRDTDAFFLRLRRKYAPHKTFVT